MRSLLLLLAAAALVVSLPAFARAEPTVTCHCFQKRTFDPADPASADPYILATTRSSLLSAAFGAGKGGLVRAVMSGTAPDDLWIAHWAGARVGRGAPGLLEEKGAKGSWKAALAGAKGLGAPFEKALAAGKPDGALAALAVDDVLLARLGASAEDVAALRASGARSEEVVLAAVLAVHGRTAAMPILARVRAGSATWGTALRDAGLAPADMDAAVRRLVR
jgi:hypothetical protein